MGAEQSTEVITFAGSGSSAAREGKGSEASIGTPTSVAVDWEQNVYVTDSTNHVIWKITAADGAASILCGKNGAGPDFADGINEMARFNNPSHIYTSTDRRLMYVVDRGNRRIRRVTTGGAVSTLAGDGTAKATDSDEKRPYGSFFDPIAGVTDAHGNHFIIDGHSIRKIAANTPPPKTVELTEANAPVGSGATTAPAAAAPAPAPVELNHFGESKLKLTTVCGVSDQSGHTDGTLETARFGVLRGLTVDGLSNIYLSEADTNTIRRIGRDLSKSNLGTEIRVSTAGGVSSAAGGFVDGKVISVTRTVNESTGVETDVETKYAQFHTPCGLTFDYEWSLFICDASNHKIRRITQDYFVTTHAGSSKGFADGSLIDSQFNTPTALALDYSKGFMYVCDTGNCRIRRVKLPLGNACRACEEGQFCTIM